MPKYRRILLKLSGEAIAKKNPDGSVAEIFDENIIRGITDAVAELTRQGTQVAIVIGAGNIWRGAYGKGVKRARADQMGMLGTMINCLRLEKPSRDWKRAEWSYSAAEPECLSLRLTPPWS